MKKLSDAVCSSCLLSCLRYVLHCCFPLRLLYLIQCSLYYFKDVQSAPKPRFIVEDDVMEVVEDDPDAEEDDDVFDSVCAICDNGGELLWYAFC